MPDDTDHADALEAYKVCSEAAKDNEETYEKDYRFWRMDEQWPDAIKAARNTAGQERPMFTFNRGPTFARQVINDIRQNRPSIKTHPADSGADIETALVMQGLIRNINYASKGDVARDTAAECAVYGGFGYYRLDIEFAHDDTFDKDIRINRIVNPLCVKGDPYSTRADSLDWNMAFYIDLMTPDAFKETYPNADPVSFDMMDDKVRRDWTDGEDIVVAEYWKRAKAMKTVVQLSDGKVVDETWLQSQNPETGLTELQFLEAQGIAPHGKRQIETYVVDQCILNGQEQLTDKIRWAGKYIPIIPVYGEEMYFKGKRLLWSMLHRGRHAQEQFNYNETTAIELYSLAPRVPFIGEEGAFSVDSRWETANSMNHPYLEHKRGTPMPQRQQLDSGPMIGAMSLSKQAGDNLKATLGMYDASLGNRSNESSGIAIERRDRQSDVGNFHFTDNVSRAIECEGTQLLDLIPKVYTKGRIARVMGDDGAVQNVRFGSREPGMQSEQRDPNAEPPKIGSLNGVYDLGLGKYDVMVEAGPSYTTQRQETAAVIGELMRSDPRIMEIGGDILVDNLDIKGGPELARRMKKMLPSNLQDEGEQQIPPQVQAAMQQHEEMIAQLTEENNKLKQDEAGKAASVGKIKLEDRKLDVEEKKIPVLQLEKEIDLLTAQKELLAAQEKLEKTRAEAAMIQQQTRAEIAAGQNVEVLAAVPTLLNALDGVRAEVARPTHKQGRAKKINGEWRFETVEVPGIGAQ